MTDTTQRDLAAANAVITQIAGMTQDQIEKSPAAMAVLTKLGELMEQSQNLVALEGDRGPSSRSHNSNLFGLNDTQKLALLVLQHPDLQNPALMAGVTPHAQKATIVDIGNQFVREVQRQDHDRAGGLSAPDIFRDPQSQSVLGQERPLTDTDRLLLQSVRAGMSSQPDITREKPMAAADDSSHGDDELLNDARRDGIRNGALVVGNAVRNLANGLQVENNTKLLVDLGRAYDNTLDQHDMKVRSPAEQEQRWLEMGKAEAAKIQQASQSGDPLTLPKQVQDFLSGTGVSAGLGMQPMASDKTSQNGPAIDPGELRRMVADFVSMNPEQVGGQGTLLLKTGFGPSAAPAPQAPPDGGQQIVAKIPSMNNS